MIDIFVKTKKPKKKKYKTAGIKWMKKLHKWLKGVK